MSERSLPLRPLGSSSSIFAYFPINLTYCDEWLIVRNSSTERPGAALLVHSLRARPLQIALARSTCTSLESVLKNLQELATYHGKQSEKNDFIRRQLLPILSVPLALCTREGAENS